MTSIVEKPIVIYDGNCRLCQGAVRFLKTKKNTVGFEFIPSSNSASEQLLRNFQLSKELSNNTIILIEGNTVFTKSTAVIRSLQMRGGIWRLFGILRIIPEFMRNLVYDWIAMRR